MRFKSNIKEVIADFEKFQKENDVRLKNMVIGFSVDVVNFAINTTPFGEYNSLYDIPNRIAFFTGSTSPGMAKAGWIVDFNTSRDITTPDYPAESADASSIKLRNEADLQRYTLGDTVLITNSVPYVATEGFVIAGFGSLEGGYSKQAKEGITKPTLAEITSVFQLNLQTYYNDYGV